jgi:hypothetical protein
LDPKATAPVLVLNVQNRSEAPVTLLGALVNDDPKCIPEYDTKVPFKQADPGLTPQQYASMMNGIMKVLLVTKGINILTPGYSKELKFGEIEKLSLGSSAFGGCDPVKLVVTTDHGSSTFNFE